MALSLSAIEKSLDIPAAQVETILSLLELTSVARRPLVRVEGSYFDHITGRFRVMSTKLADLSRSDVIVRGLLAINTVQDEGEDRVSTAAECRMKSISQSSGGYGLGNGEYSERTHSASEVGVTPRGNSYGSSIVSFACSRLTLALECGLTVQEVSNGLYSLQCRGLLEYTLDDSCVYLEVMQDDEGEGEDLPTENTHIEKHLIMRLRDYLTTIGEANCKHLSTANYHAYVWYAARHVHSLLRSINSLASERIVDMWRVGSTICRYSAIPEEKGDLGGKTGRGTVPSPTHSPEEVQAALQQFVCCAMEQIKEGDVSAERLNHVSCSFY